MTELHALWLPILLSSVFVFLASSVIHMASPWLTGLRKLIGRLHTYPPVGRATESSL